MPRYCCILTCKNFRGCPSESSVSFFRPPQDVQIREKWIRSIRKYQGISNQFKICQLHFDMDCFFNRVRETSQLRLRPNAIPTIFTTNPFDQKRHAVENEKQVVNVNAEPKIQYTYSKKTKVIVLNGTKNVIPNMFETSSYNLPIKTEPMSDEEKEEPPRVELDTPCNYIKQEPVDGQEKSYDPLNGQTIVNTDVQVTKSQVSSQVPSSSKQCYRCIGQDVQLQRYATKIKSLKAECKEKTKTIRKLRHSLSQLKNKVRPLELIYAKNLKEYCEVCQQSYYPHVEDHICEKGINEICCDYCGKSFKSIVLILDHLIIHHHEKTFFECDKCPSIFSMALLLEFHQKKHLDCEQESGQEFSCEICDGIFYTKYQIRNHMIECHSGEAKNQLVPHQCGTCGRYFKNEGHLKLHARRAHEKMEALKFECYMCQLKLKSLYDTRLHIELDHQRNENCQVCTNDFTTKEINEHLCNGLSGCAYCHQPVKTTKALLQHLEKDCKGEKLLYKCDICLKFFGMELLRDVHMKHHSTIEKNFLCDLCPSRFSNSTALSKHKFRHTQKDGPGLYLCDQCGKEFKCARNLSIHQQVHEEKNLKCLNCDFSTNKKERLIEHKTRNHQNYKVVCNICKAVLSSKRGLSSHMRVHRRTDEDRKYTCAICKKKFHKKAWKRHLLSHSNEKPFVCEFCGQAYKYNGDLMQHKRHRHVGDNLYACENCPKRFRYKSQFVRHKHVCSKNENG
ncbi:zinc finger protein 43-like isoform X2 [Contarinia nasturtii]|uniref:zinc finger protein 43-like isoform X2 n=1 Tax=Contarinia nasturtii TaxID=265458 RepID=UPI0012D3A84E|nr:zinc finger protein 43-like isoform X2 [Contarinia nasturtii]